MNRSGDVGALEGGVSVLGVGVNVMGAGAEDWRFVTVARYEGSLLRYMGRPVTGG